MRALDGLQIFGSYIQSSGKIRRKAKGRSPCRLRKSQVKFWTECWLNDAGSKKMISRNLIIHGPKLWMAYTFQWGKHGIRCAWSSLSIDYSSPSRKRHRKFWTLNSSNQKWYGEKEIGILLEFLKNTLHIFPFSKPGSLIQSIYGPSSKLFWIVHKAWFWFMVSNKSTIILFACYFLNPQKYIHTKINEILVCSILKKINTLAAWWSYFSSEKQGKWNH